MGTWTVCGLPAVAAITRHGAFDRPAMAWAAAFICFGIALIVAFRSRATARGVAIVFVAIQSTAAILLIYIVGIMLDPTAVGLLAGIGLMVIVAAQLPHLVRPLVACSWIGSQTLAMALLVIDRIGLADALTFGFGAAGFQMFAAMTTGLMLREAAARVEFARTNAELLATRALLAESSRAGERLRIARDLHDTLGHHLTALSLQLDVSARLADGKAAEHVRQAHAITRLLLADVRSVVGEMRGSGQTDFARAIRTLAEVATTPAIHLDMPEPLRIDDHSQAQSLLRCVQEIITNASRHADARNLWIRIEPSADGIALHARDDGRGADAVRIGNGLKGMRERFAEHAGRVEFGTKRGEGFEIHGFMPTAQAAS